MLATLIISCDNGNLTTATNRKYGTQSTADTLTRTFNGNTMGGKHNIRRDNDDAKDHQIV